MGVLGFSKGARLVGELLLREKLREREIIHVRSIVAAEIWDYGGRAVSADRDE